MPQQYNGLTAEQLEHLATEKPKWETMRNMMQQYDDKHSAQDVVKETIAAQHQAITKKFDTMPNRTPLEEEKAKLWKKTMEDAQAQGIQNSPVQFAKRYLENLKEQCATLSEDKDLKGLVAKLKDPNKNTELLAVRKMVALEDIAIRMDERHERNTKLAKKLVDNLPAPPAGAISTDVLEKAIKASETKQAGHLDKRAIEGFKTQIEQLNKSLEDLQKTVKEEGKNPVKTDVREQAHKVDQQLSQIALLFHNQNAREILVNAVGAEPMKELSKELRELQNKVPQDLELMKKTLDTRMPVSIMDRFHDIWINRLPTKKELMTVDINAGRKRLKIPMIDDEKPIQRIALDTSKKEQSITIGVRERQPDGSYKTRTATLDNLKDVDGSPLKDVDGSPLNLKDNSGKLLNCNAREAAQAVHEFNQQALKERLPGGPKQGQPFYEIQIDIKRDGSWSVDAHDENTKILVLKKMLEIQNLRPENIAKATLNEAKETVTHKSADLEADKKATEPPTVTQVTTPRTPGSM